MKMDYILSQYYQHMRGSLIGVSFFHETGCPAACSLSVLRHGANL